MPGPIEAFLAADHTRMDALLDRACPPGGPIDPEAFAEFRQGLLRHIGMEEKVLYPYARTQRGGEPLEIAKILRKDHGEIAALLVPSPTVERCQTLRAVLTRHNALEEGQGGAYVQCEALAQADGKADELVARMQAQPEVPMAPYYDGPLLRPR